MNYEKGKSKVDKMSCVWTHHIAKVAVHGFNQKMYELQDSQLVLQIKGKQLRENHTLQPKERQGYEFPESL